MVQTAQDLAALGAEIDTMLEQERQGAGAIEKAGRILMDWRCKLGALFVRARKEFPAKGKGAKGWGDFVAARGVSLDSAARYIAVAEEVKANPGLALGGHKMIDVYRILGIAPESGGTLNTAVAAGLNAAPLLVATYQPHPGDRVTWKPPGHKGTGLDAEVLRPCEAPGFWRIRVEGKGVPPREEAAAAEELTLVRRPAPPADRPFTERLFAGPGATTIVQGEEGDDAQRERETESPGAGAQGDPEQPDRRRPPAAPDHRGPLAAGGGDPVVGGTEAGSGAGAGKEGVDAGRRSAVGGSLHGERGDLVPAGRDPGSEGDGARTTGGAATGKAGEAAPVVCAECERLRARVRELEAEVARLQHAFSDESQLEAPEPSTETGPTPAAHCSAPELTIERDPAPRRKGQPAPAPKPRGPWAVGDEALTPGNKGPRRVVLCGLAPDGSWHCFFRPRPGQVRKDPWDGATVLPSQLSPDPNKIGRGPALREALTALKAVRERRLPTWAEEAERYAGEEG